MGGTTLGETADQDTVTFTYSPQGALETATSTICSTPQSSTIITNSYDAVGRLLQETFSQHDGTTTYGYTTAGKPKSYTDVTGKTWAVTENDEYGRPTMVADEDVQLALNYDALGRLHTWTSTDKATNATLTTAVTWDTLDREQNRQVTNSAKNTAWKLEQEYYLNHQLSSKTMKRETGSTLNTVRTETYSYDERNRLTDYTCTGSDPVRDDKGNAIAQQSFAYDTYNNITKAVTEFSSGDPDTAIFTYGNAQDPCQLTSVSHSHNDFPAETYTYDAAGCLNADASGRQFTYDTGINCGYLRSVTQEDVTSNFVYDPLNRVIGEDDTSLVYCGSTLVNQRQGNDAVRFVGGGSVGTLAQVRSGDNAGVWLSGSEANGSVLSVDNASASTKHYDIAYGPYGETPSNQSTPSALGYNGQRKSNLLDGYQLGNGYRLYQPSLRRFTAPDSESPFGAGGINSYAYCAGDPINNTDPTGHFPVLGAIMGTASLLMIPFTAGASAAGAAAVDIGADASAAVEAGGEVAAETAEARSSTGPVRSRAHTSSAVSLRNTPYDRPRSSTTLGDETRSRGNSINSNGRNKVSFGFTDKDGGSSGFNKSINALESSRASKGASINDARKVDPTHDYFNKSLKEGEPRTSTSKKNPRARLTPHKDNMIIKQIPYEDNSNRIQIGDVFMMDNENTNIRHWNNGRHPFIVKRIDYNHRKIKLIPGSTLNTDYIDLEKINHRHVAHSIYKGGDYFTLFRPDMIKSYNMNELSLDRRKLLGRIDDLTLLR
ncbi:MAG: RHS repeat-associated core domain-containing protein [Brucella sp.]